MTDTSLVDSGSADVQTHVDAAVAESAEVNSTEVDAGDGEQPAESNDKPRAEDFSAKAKNAIRYRDRKLSKANARIRELEALKNHYEQAYQSKASELKAPAENQFDNFGDLVKADARYEVKKEILAAEKASQSELLTKQHQEAVAQREAEIAESAAEFSKAVADYQQTIAPVLPVVDALPAQIQAMIRDLDNPVAALYTLAKERRLESLAYANPHFAAVTLLQAQERGENFYSSQAQRLDATKQTRAPEPMRGARGTATSTSKSLESMNAKELLKWVGN